MPSIDTFVAALKGAKLLDLRATARKTADYQKQVTLRQDDWLDNLFNDKAWTKSASRDAKHPN